MRVLLDTNVLVAGLRSRRGASFQLLRLLGAGKFEPVISVPLLLEYEEVLKRQTTVLGMAAKDIDDVLDYLCSIGHRQAVFFLWRPILPDPDDDMILELAVASGCKIIVTFNRVDFAAFRQFGIAVLTPVEFLKHIGEKP